jgi:hypothetical protein
MPTFVASSITFKFTLMNVALASHDNYLFRMIILNCAVMKGHRGAKEVVYDYI